MIINLVLRVKLERINCCDDDATNLLFAYAGGKNGFRPIATLWSFVLSPYFVIRNVVDGLTKLERADVPR